MNVSDYNYELPDNLIAKNPPEIRGTSRLLVLNRQTGQVLDKKYKDIIDFLNPGDVLVLNNTKVIKARLFVKRSDGAEREILILEKHILDEDWHKHQVIYKGKLHVGDILSIGSAKIVVDEILGGGIATVTSNQDLLKLANKYGNVPLPPYLHREANENDVKRYQSVWAKAAGSVAAPTASLNMTSSELLKIQQKGIRVVYITLHVGLGTFLPIRSDKIEEHEMHKEYFEIPKEVIEVIQKAKGSKNNIIALGTTVTRALEYANKQILQQKPTDVSGEANIFIYPGYKFKVINHLITNYHAPRSTVLMLAAAFAGWDKLLPAYQHAVEEKYNFLSYGDSMLIL